MKKKSFSNSGLFFDFQQFFLKKKVLKIIINIFILEYSFFIRIRLSLNPPYGNHTVYGKWRWIKIVALHDIMINTWSWDSQQPQHKSSHLYFYFSILFVVYYLGAGPIYWELDGSLTSIPVYQIIINLHIFQSTKS